MGDGGICEGVRGSLKCVVLGGFSGFGVVDSHNGLFHFLTIHFSFALRDFRSRLFLPSCPLALPPSRSFSSPFLCVRFVGSCLLSFASSAQLAPKV